ncbi:hypothetical protein JCGZ_25837 [Jatropha curcas]|uniref:H/ACA ribonucleoprotein complex non-core subunit NAF1 n=1 Tax=Jatropha curcas TaxID=180498 RepID=A0A067JW23_JATCU|nr:H/ACA ribonucleoprotein complex non-core subunit NAF1 [Jatropha curcas]KDP24180.1 hypothetical protein JCGZ_25837 [Jatropha curcas]
MVGFLPKPTIVDEEEYNQASKSKNFQDPIEDVKLSDLSFADSFLDFDSIKDFFEDSTGKRKMADEGSCFESRPMMDCSNPSFEEPIDSGSGCVVMVKDEKVGLEEEGSLGSSIEEAMGKVSLVRSSPVCGDGIVVKEVSLISGPCSVVTDGSVAEGGVASSKMDTGNINLATESCSVIGVGVSDIITANENGSGSDSGSASASSSSSTSSSDNSDSSSCNSSDDDDDDGEEEEEVRLQLNREVEEGEIEEGEIRDINGGETVGKTADDEEEEEDEDDGYKMLDWSDVEFDNVEEAEAEEDAYVAKGPIMSKNELKVLPPVPPVDVTLQPHHQMLPVGTVLSILGAQVIVEGVEKHNPLNEGSILWITEKRSPLGLVDEIFGPVQNPYYVVRYNSESEVPAGIHQGTSISFTPEFANHVLKDKDLYKKGYDASGDNDEELSDDAEFSDDEKEAEYRRMQKMSKRGMNCQTVGNKKNNRKKVNNRNVNWKNDIPSGQQNLMGVSQPPPDQNQQNRSSVGVSMNNCSTSTTGQDFHGGTSFFPSFPPIVPTAGVFQPSNGIWVNGLPPQHPQNGVVPGGFPTNNIPWPAQNQLPHQMPFQQQFNPNQSPIPTGMLSGAQMNLFAGPSPWPPVLGQNCFNQATFGMGFQGQPAPNLNTINMGDKVMLSSGPLMGQNGNQSPLPVVPDNSQAPRQYNPGASTSNRRKPFHHRRGGRFAGGRGRGRQPSNEGH